MGEELPDCGGCGAHPSSTCDECLMCVVCEGHDRQCELAYPDFVTFGGEV